MYYANNKEITNFENTLTNNKINHFWIKHIIASIWYLFLPLSQGKVLELAAPEAVVVGQLHEVAGGVGAG